jgi:HAD superfamily hydrolase (TIGR01509 family)
MKIFAVIFDLNGTVLEDEDEYSRAFRKVLKSLGVSATDEESHTKGIGVRENWPVLIKKFGIKTDKTLDQLAKETQDAYLSEITGVTIRTGFEDFVNKLRDSGIMVALATSNTWEVVDEVLNKTSLGGIFDIITTAEEVIDNKPDPEIFTLTADKLGVERGECLVIEDSDSGIEAAHRAGMRVIGIGDAEGADFNVKDFSEITPEIIDQL